MSKAASRPKSRSACPFLRAIEPWTSLRASVILLKVRFDERNGYTVLHRAFSILAAFQADGQDLTLAELARRTGLPKASVHRLAGQLVDVGALERRVRGTYGLGLRLFELGSVVLRQRRLRETALPLMEDLYEATHETIHLGVRDGHQVLYIEKIPGRHDSSAKTSVGTRKPLHCTALGKAILAYSGPQLLDDVARDGLYQYTSYTITTVGRLQRELDQVGRTGVAFDREEYSLGVSCVASAVRDCDNSALAALSITGPTHAFHPDDNAAAVRTAALTLTRILSQAHRPV